MYRPVRNPPYTPISVLKLITGKRRFTRGQRAYRPYQEPLLSQQVVYAEMRSRNVLDHQQKAIDLLKKFVPGGATEKWLQVAVLEAHSSNGGQNDAVEQNPDHERPGHRLCRCEGKAGDQVAGRVCHIGTFGLGVRPVCNRLVAARRQAAESWYPNCGLRLGELSAPGAGS